MSVREAIWRWLTFCTNDDKSAMGPNLLQKQQKFPIYVREYKEMGHVNEVVLWVLSRVMREPIAILLKGEFWITMEEEVIGDVQMLFVYGGEGQFIPIHHMTDKEMPDNVQGD